MVELYAILDNIRSLHNVGSIFRTADAFGFKKIYLCGFTPAPIGVRQKREIHKTALGAEEFIAWEKSGKISRLLEKLKKDGFYIIGLELAKKAVDLNKFKLSASQHKKKIVLIVGHERQGVSKKTLQKCDKIIQIPMVGRKESLNVSVAFGIAAFCLKNC
ncbi:MAG: RNA methyltransferase [bacterium]|nr:RNA methyltransferase [bacterium]